MSVNSNIGKLAGVISSSSYLSSKISTGPIVDAGYQNSAIVVGDYNLSQMVRSFSNRNFVWGVHRWGDSDRKVGK